MLTQTRLKELLSYNPVTGIFRWKSFRGGSAKIGSVAGGPGLDGYWRIKVDGVRHLTHRIVWLYYHGRWPKDQLDHINNIKKDNRIGNLREVNNMDNCRNQRRIRKNNKSGYLGVSWNKKHSKWVAQISADGTNKHLGYFSDPKEALEIYVKMKIALHNIPKGWVAINEI